jgi:hypothetical protein
MYDSEGERFKLGLQDLKHKAAITSPSGNSTRYGNAQPLCSSSSGQCTIFQAVDNQTNKLVVLKKSAASMQMAHQVLLL